MRRMGPSATLLLATAIGLSGGPTLELSAQDFPASASLPEEARQFDFWVGEWDVDLRVRQPDLTWEDEHTAVAKIFPILSGKAVLELWNETREEGIKGYSVRYFDPGLEEWVLWLNWPGPDRSGSSSLTGSFRHGRGEFFATRRGRDGSETISRYTFSDITEESLRWDDAFSTDGGESWTHSWIMEFTRIGPKPTLEPDGGPAHTFHDGDRCDAPEFRRYEFLSGRKEGEVVAGGRGSVTITGYRILDGCAVMTFAGADADRYELTTLTSQPRAPVRIFYSENPSELVLYERIEGEGPRDRFRIEEEDDGSVLWIHETPEADGWKPVWGGRVHPVAG